MKENIKKYLPVLGGVLLFFLLFAVVARIVSRKEGEPAKEAGDAGAEPKGLYAGPAKWLEENLPDEGKQALMQAFTIQEQNVYTFLQGPRSWEEGIPWSGEWSQFQVEGNPFGGFGCGLCCLANIYDTLSPYEVSPWGMFWFAKKASDYAPDGAYGAIGWEAMRDTLKRCGVQGKLHKKPGAYGKFQQQMNGSKSMVALVCSGDDDTFWQDTPGHYVNLWLYQEEDDTVFLAEPGNPERNRTRVPLRYVYDALKSSSKFQYLSIKGYLDEENQWKASRIDERWNRPEGWGAGETDL